MKRMTAFLSALVLMVPLFSGCGSAEPVEQTEFMLNTYCTITLYNPNDQSLLAEAFDLCRTLEEKLSRTVENSDVDQINQGGEMVAISSETAEVLQAALEYSELSEGRFDITVGALTALWDFQAEEPQKPSQDAINQALASVGYDKLLLEGNSAALTDLNAIIDLGAIAKGYIADRVKEFLVGRGVERAIINLGGNVVTIGSKESDTLWKVGIQKPFGSDSEIMGTIEVDGKSVVTSGIYERYFLDGDTIYHHILDPSTGYPADTDLASAVIISDSSMEGDALSTICVLLGSEQALELIESIAGVECVLITRNDQVMLSSGMGQYNFTQSGE